jgi:hypothetical protein
MGQCKVCRWLWSEMNNAWLLSDDNKANFGDVFTRCCLWRVLVLVVMVVVVDSLPWCTISDSASVNLFLINAPLFS